MTVEAKPARPAWRPSPLMVRIVFGALLVAAIYFLVYIGLAGVWILILVLGGLGLWEFGGLSDGMGFRAPGWLLYPLGIYLAFSGTLLKSIELQLVLSIALVAGLAAFLFLPGQREGLGRWAMGMAGAIYIGLPMNYYLELYTSSPEHGRAWVIFTVLTAALSDIGALLVGGAIGRTPFFPAISPKKTVEGAVAGVLICIPAMVLGAVSGLQIPLGHAVVLGVLVGVSAMVGDLVESQMKRVAGVKDSSRLIPGHGGMLDRMDSVLFPPIVVFVYASVFHLLS
jgi:phosphatidate cytidylyltransferase